MKYIPADVIHNFFEELTNSKILYVLIKNVSNELPDYLIDGKDIDIVVHEDYIKEFEQFMISHNFEKQIPPLGRENGWNFAYKLPEYQFWKLKDDRFTFYIDASFKLSCKSLTPKMWIPLDKCINNDIWKNKVFDEKNHWWIMDDGTILIYLIVRSIFDKREFKQGYVDGIEERKKLLKEKGVQYKLSKIFFHYTGPLIEQISKSQYDSIIENYLTFTEY